MHSVETLKMSEFDTYCDDCTDVDLCPFHERQWNEAECDREFDERVALGYV